MATLGLSASYVAFRFGQATPADDFTMFWGIDAEAGTVDFQVSEKPRSKLRVQQI